jgi:hypothetical protein
MEGIIKSSKLTIEDLKDLTPNEIFLILQHKRGITVKVTRESHSFRTKNGNEYYLSDEIILVSSDKKSRSSDRMIPHRCMKYILESYGIDIKFIKTNIPNISFIAKNPQIKSFNT